ncbi:MAG: 16S rRNA (guanine(966)-N(2))-methyltransferase RsmD [Clostridia bacterium]|nr:16S rRNA (guanine(966)-N(2))-methyltransferase RsmD [Clostridia bacterium]
MRVIAGSEKGRKLEPLMEKWIRPTTDKVKESIFNVIQFEIAGKSFLDLFSGSGQIAVEALSRGAAAAVLVDISPKAVKTIASNLKKSNCLDKAEVLNMDYLTFLKSNNRLFDIAFLDPPYKTGMLQKALGGVAKIMNENGIIICESSLDESLPAEIDRFYLYRSFKYGKIKTWFYRVKD